MRYDRTIEKERLERINEQLINYMKEYPKRTLSLTAIGNSISDGFSMSEPGALLLDRNLELIECGKKRNIEVETYQLSRSENNNALIVYDWIINNYSEKDSHDWNMVDYRRLSKEGNPLLTEEEITMLFTGGFTKGIQDIVFDSTNTKANIIILNLGTGSFLDVVTRHGSLSLPNLFNSVDRDVFGITAILELIQNNNRMNGSNTQVYLCGAPRIMNTFITDVFMNPKIRKAGSQYANVTYVPSFPRQAFYKTPNLGIIPDPHYNEAEYYHLLSEIETKIIDNYLIRNLMIDLDRTLFAMSNRNDIKDVRFSKNDIKAIIDEIAKKYESREGDYNYFIEFIKTYIKDRYPFDFYRGSEEKNLVKELNSLKRYR